MPVALAPVLDAVAANASDPVTGAVVAELNPGGLRPSIETTLHALAAAPGRGPHPFGPDDRARDPRRWRGPLAERLAGLAWAWIPYCKPGLPLTAAVAERLRDRPADVLVLGNHGLVVGAESVAKGDALLREVERRLDRLRERLPAPPAPPPVAGWRTLPTP